jgi:hypothetical protein
LRAGRSTRTASAPKSPRIIRDRDRDRDRERDESDDDGL